MKTVQGEKEWERFTDFSVSSTKIIKTQGETKKKVKNILAILCILHIFSCILHIQNVLDLQLLRKF